VSDELGLTNYFQGSLEKEKLGLMNALGRS
jgi:hypothetical protein